MFSNGVDSSNCAAGSGGDVTVLDRPTIVGFRLAARKRSHAEAVAGEGDAGGMRCDTGDTSGGSGGSGVDCPRPAGDHCDDHSSNMQHSSMHGNMSCRGTVLVPSPLPPSSSGASYRQQQYPRHYHHHYYHHNHLSRPHRQSHLKSQQQQQQHNDHHSNYNHHHGRFPHPNAHIHATPPPQPPHPGAGLESSPPLASPTWHVDSSCCPQSCLAGVASRDAPSPHPAPPAGSIMQPHHSGPLDSLLPQPRGPSAEPSPGTRCCLSNLKSPLTQRSGHTSPVDQPTAAAAKADCGSTCCCCGSGCGGNGSAEHSVYTVGPASVGPYPVRQVAVCGDAVDTSHAVASQVATPCGGNNPSVMPAPAPPPPLVQGFVIPLPPVTTGLPLQCCHPHQPPQLRPAFPQHQQQMCGAGTVAAPATTASPLQLPPATVGSAGSSAAPGVMSPDFTPSPKPSVEQVATAAAAATSGCFQPKDCSDPQAAANMRAQTSETVWLVPASASGRHSPPCGPSRGAPLLPPPPAGPSANSALGASGLVQRGSAQTQTNTAMAASIHTMPNPPTRQQQLGNVITTGNGIERGMPLLLTSGSGGKQQLTEAAGPPPPAAPPAAAVLSAKSSPPPPQTSQDYSLTPSPPPPQQQQPRQQTNAPLEAVLTPCPRPRLAVAPNAVTTGARPVAAAGLTYAAAGLAGPADGMMGEMPQLFSSGGLGGIGGCIAAKQQQQYPAWGYQGPLMMGGEPTKAQPQLAHCRLTREGGAETPAPAAAWEGLADDATSSCSFRDLRTRRIAAAVSAAGPFPPLPKQRQLQQQHQPSGMGEEKEEEKQEVEEQEEEGEQEEEEDEKEEEQQEKEENGARELQNEEEEDGEEEEEGQDQEQRRQQRGQACLGAALLSPGPKRQEDNRMRLDCVSASEFQSPICTEAVASVPVLPLSYHSHQQHHHQQHPDNGTQQTAQDLPYGAASAAAPLPSDCSSGQETVAVGMNDRGPGGIVQHTKEGCWPVRGEGFARYNASAISPSSSWGLGWPYFSSGTAGRQSGFPPPVVPTDGGPTVQLPRRTRVRPSDGDSGPVRSSYWDEMEPTYGSACLSQEPPPPLLSSMLLPPEDERDATGPALSTSGTELQQVQPPVPEPQSQSERLEQPVSAAMMEAVAPTAACTIPLSNACYCCNCNSGGGGNADLPNGDSSSCQHVQHAGDQTPQPPQQQEQQGLQQQLLLQPKKGLRQQQHQQDSGCTHEGLEKGGAGKGERVASKGGRPSYGNGDDVEHNDTVGSMAAALVHRGARQQLPQQLPAPCYSDGNASGVPTPYGIGAVPSRRLPYGIQSLSGGLRSEPPCQQPSPPPSAPPPTPPSAGTAAAAPAMLLCGTCSCPSCTAQVRRHLSAASMLLGPDAAGVVGTAGPAHVVGASASPVAAAAPSVGAVRGSRPGPWARLPCSCDLCQRADADVLPNSTTSASSYSPPALLPAAAQPQQQRNYNNHLPTQQSTLPAAGPPLPAQSALACAPTCNVSGGGSRSFQLAQQPSYLTSPPLSSMASLGHAPSGQMASSYTSVPCRMPYSMPYIYEPPPPTLTVPCSCPACIAALSGTAAAGVVPPAVTLAANIGGPTQPPPPPLDERRSTPHRPASLVLPHLLDSCCSVTSTALTSGGVANGRPPPPPAVPRLGPYPNNAGSGLSASHGPAALSLPHHPPPQAPGPPSAYARPPSSYPEPLRSAGSQPQQLLSQPQPQNDQYPAPPEPPQLRQGQHHQQQQQRPPSMTLDGPGLASPSHTQHCPPACPPTCLISPRCPRCPLVGYSSDGAGQPLQLQTSKSSLPLPSAAATASAALGAAVRISQSGPGQARTGAMQYSTTSYCDAAVTVPSLAHAASMLPEGSAVRHGSCTASRFEASCNMSHSDAHGRCGVGRPPSPAPPPLPLFLALPPPSAATMAAIADDPGYPGVPQHSTAEVPLSGPVPRQQHPPLPPPQSRSHRQPSCGGLSMQAEAPAAVAEAAVAVTIDPVHPCTVCSGCGAPLPGAVATAAATDMTGIWQSPLQYGTAPAVTPNTHATALGDSVNPIGVAPQGALPGAVCPAASAGLYDESAAAGCTAVPPGSWNSADLQATSALPAVEFGSGSGGDGGRSQMLLVPQYVCQQPQPPLHQRGMSLQQQQQQQQTLPAAAAMVAVAAGVPETAEGFTSPDGAYRQLPQQQLAYGSTAATQVTYGSVAAEEEEAMWAEDPISPPWPRRAGGGRLM